MAKEKLEPRLAEELERVAQAGSPTRRIPVIIEHVKVASPSGGDRGAGLAALEREVRELQRPIVERLRELGAGPTVRQHILANAVSADLTPIEIAEMAKHPDVRLIRLAREDQVTTG
ncbi:MAG: hypothetical protein ACM3ML_03295 [Micromonosporaceae bacterium]